MIRLNDINNTVIDESKVVAYYEYEEEKTYCISIVLNIKLFVDYNSKEARDKDIELLDKLFDVKNIEDYVYGRYPDETQTIKKTSEPVKEEYLTWEDVRQSEKLIEAELPNGDIKLICYEDDDIVIESDTHREARIYDENLFNALMLKKVE